MKSKIGSIVKYTVEKNVRNKWFIVLNILLLLVTVLGFNFGNIQKLFKDNNISFNSEKINIIVIDNDNLIYPKIEKAFEDKKDKVNIGRQDILEYNKDTLDKNTIFLDISSSDTDLIKAKIVSKEGINQEYLTPITNLIKEAKYDIFSNKYGISKDNIDVLMKEPSIERVMVGVENAENSDMTQIIQTALNYLVLIILMFSLSKIANEISQEKMSKSIEYVLTSINEKAYLIAKVISINLTLIIQFLFGIVYAIIGMGINSIFKLQQVTSEVGGTVDIGSLPNIINAQTLAYILVFVVFVILTVLILSVIQAALSSKTTNISEAGNATIFFITINLILYMAASFIISPLNTPNIVIYIISCIPIISMYFVPTMILAGHATVIQVIIATVLLIASIPLVFKFSSKVFKNGILDYSNKKQNKKIKKQLTLEEKQKQAISKREYSKYGFVIGFSVILFIAIQLLASLLLTPLVEPIYNILNAKISMANITNIITLISYAISLVVPILFVFQYVDKKDKFKVKKEKLDKKQSIKYILMAMPVIAIIQILLSVVLDKLGLNYDATQGLYSSSSIFSMILLTLQVAILPAILEELFIRKAVLSFSKKYGIIFAVITSSLLFAVIHLNVSQIIFAFLIGIIFAIITLKTNSIIPAGILHFLNNGYAVFMLIFENNKIALNIVNGIYILLILMGVYCIIRYIASSKKTKIKDIVKEYEDSSYLEEINGDKQVVKFRYIFTDYTFIISILLSLVMLFLTQSIISM